MSAPNLKEIEWAIAELEKEESSFPLYAKLANLYTVRDKMTGGSIQQPHIAAYSEATPIPEAIGQYGDSDFLRAVAGKNPDRVWLVLDEFMESLSVVNRKAYNNLVRRLESA